MPYKKPDREHWYTWPTLPGFGRVGPWSTGTKQERIARRMEDWLREVVLVQPDVVRGIVDGKYSLRDAWVAKLEGKLDQLTALASDPPLSEVIERFRPLVANRRVGDGLKHLERLAPPRARFSYLLEPRNITDLCAKLMDEGQKPNSVRRSLYRAISDMLAYEIGKKRRAQILADVVKPGEDDTRHVTVSPEEVQAILRAADPEVYPMVLVAITTGIDLGPMLRLEVRHFDPEAGTILAPDTKTSSRWRRIPLPAITQAALQRQVTGREPGERIFTMPRTTLNKRWQALRRSIGREDLRWKDLRHVFATFFTQAGGTVADLGSILGHTNRETTLRYTAAQLRTQAEQMERAVAQMGILQVEHAGK